jgi:branched-subunit amino acid ABC-type transport system permease component
VQPFIATLAGQWFARGLCFFISDDAIPINDRIYRILGQTKILIPGLSDPVTQQGNFISILVILEVIVLGVAIFIAHFTRFGRTVYAIGGNEQSARLMGLPASTTKMLVYTFNGFCSALAGIALSIYVMSGHGWYADGFEMDVIASVVIGGTMLTGGVGYVFGTLFGVLINGVIQTLIQFNGQLSSHWTRIAVGVLTLIFIGVQSLLSARKTRRLASRKPEIYYFGSDAYAIAGARAPQAGTRKAGALGRWFGLLPRGWQVLIFCAAIIVIILGVNTVNRAQNASQGMAVKTSSSTSTACQLKPFRTDQAASLIKAGAIIAYERNGGPTCIAELYAIYPDGRIVGDDGAQKTENQVEPAVVEKLLSNINDRGWFTDEMYDTWHTPCGQCFAYHLTVAYQGQEKTVQAVDGGTDAPANYWQVVSAINGIIPKFESP